MMVKKKLPSGMKMACSNKSTFIVAFKGRERINTIEARKLEKELALKQEDVQEENQNQDEIPE